MGSGAYARDVVGRFLSVPCALCVYACMCVCVCVCVCASVRVLVFVCELE